MSAVNKLRCLRSSRGLAVSIAYVGCQLDVKTDHSYDFHRFQLPMSAVNLPVPGTPITILSVSIAYVGCQHKSSR